jgi:hypothetical protein
MSISARSYYSSLDNCQENLRYLRGTISLGLQLSRSDSTLVSAFSGADWAGYPDVRRLICEFVVYMGLTSTERTISRASGMRRRHCPHAKTLR